MARRYGEPIPVLARDGQPVAFTWRGVTYQVRVIGTWRLSTRWWETMALVDRTYFRVQTTDQHQQVFELYCETARNERWVLDVCQD